MDYPEWAEAAQLIADAEAAMQRQDYEIRNDRDAVWLCRVLEAYTHEVTVRLESLNTLLAEYKTWREAAKKRLEAKEAWAHGLAEDYVRRHPERLIEAKSISLPGGRRMGWRWQAAQYEITNREDHERWCKTYGFVETMALPLSALTLRVHKDDAGTSVEAEVIDQQTGEVSWVQVPGVMMTRPAADKFSMTLAKQKDGGRLPPLAIADDRDEKDGEA